RDLHQRVRRPAGQAGDGRADQVVFGTGHGGARRQGDGFRVDRIAARVLARDAIFGVGSQLDRVGAACILDDVVGGPVGQTADIIAGVAGPVDQRIAGLVIVGADGDLVAARVRDTVARQVAARDLRLSVDDV